MYCWIHGEQYGDTCPICAGEASAESVVDAVREAADLQADAVREAAAIQAAAIAKAAQRHAEEEAKTRQAVAESAARHEKATAEAWKLRAEAKSVRAWELYQAGMWKEAADLARAAIEQEDPANINLHICAAWSLLALRVESEAKVYFEKQIRLLGLPEHSDSSATFLKVFQGLPNDVALLDAFDEVVDRACSSWPVNGQLALIEKYLSRGRKSAADRLLKELNVDGMEIRASSMVIQADLLEFGVRYGESDVKPFRRFLKRIPCCYRTIVPSGFGDMLKNKGRYSAKTLTLVTEEIRARYDEWKPDVTKLISQEANYWAQVHSSGVGMGVLAGSGASFIGFMLLSTIRSMSSNSGIADVAALGDHAISIVAAFSIFGFGIIVGVIVSRLRKQSVLRREEEKMLDALWSREQELWGGLCGEVKGR